MARTFDGANATDQLSRTVSTTGITVWSMGVWCNFSTYATGRTILGWGTAAANMCGLCTGASTAQRFVLRMDGLTDLIMEVAAPATGAWTCLVGVWDGSATATNQVIYTGSQSAAMSSQAHVTNTNGGTLAIPTTTCNIGKNNAASTAVAATLAFPFIVPWVMRADEAERYRQGDWGVLWRGGSPSMFVPMENGGAATYDLAVPGNWTVTSTPTIAADPPIAFGFQSTVAKVEKRAPVETPQSVSGAITPTGALTPGARYTKALSGAFT